MLLFCFFGMIGFIAIMIGLSINEKRKGGPKDDIAEVAPKQPDSEALAGTRSSAAKFSGPQLSPNEC